MCFSEGDCVSVRIPRIDQTISDVPRLPCMVVEVKHNVYRLRYFIGIRNYIQCIVLILITISSAIWLLHSRSKFGVIHSCFPVDQLEPYTGSLPFGMVGWKDAPTLSLHEAAKKQALWNSFTDNSCHCRTGCGTKKWQCRRQGISCSSHCHSQRDCTNKSYRYDFDVHQHTYLLLGLQYAVILMLDYLAYRESGPSEEVVISSNEEGMSLTSYWIPDLLFKESDRETLVRSEELNDAIVNA